MENETDSRSQTAKKGRTEQRGREEANSHSLSHNTSCESTQAHYSNKKSPILKQEIAFLGILD